MQQQQPGTVTHSRISSLLISRRLTKPGVASPNDIHNSEKLRNPFWSGSAILNAAPWTPAVMYAKIHY